MKKWLAVLIALSALAAFSPAPMNIPPPAGSKISPELSQAQREKQQSDQRVIGEVGSVNMHPDEQTINSQSHSEDEAQNIMNASQIVKEAGKEINSPQHSRNWTFLWAFIVCALGFGVVYGFRRWANNSLPDAPEIKRLNW